MSGYVTGWVLKHSEAEGAARMVLVVLADHASSDGTDAFPTVETIQAEARLKSRRSVQHALRVLEQAGEIAEAGKGSKGQTNWTVLMPGGAFDDRGGRNICAPRGASDDALARGSDVQFFNRPFNRPKPLRAPRAEEEVEVSQPRLLDPLPSPSAEIDSVWERYVEAMKPRRAELDPQSRALIREALKVATAVECKLAIAGCHASPFHMGDNDRGKKYNRLSHILKGKRGGRTTREQIDFFVDIAEKEGAGSADTSVDPYRLGQAKRDVLTAWEFPGSKQAKKAGEMSAAWLAQHGYRIVPDPDTGRPTFRTAE